MGQRWYGGCDEGGCGKGEDLDDDVQLAGDDSRINLFLGVKLFILFWEWQLGFET